MYLTLPCRATTDLTLPDSLTNCFYGIIICSSPPPQRKTCAAIAQLESRCTVSAYHITTSMTTPESSGTHLSKPSQSSAIAGHGNHAISSLPSPHHSIVLSAPSHSPQRHSDAGFRPNLLPQAANHLRSTARHPGFQSCVLGLDRFQPQ